MNQYAKPYLQPYKGKNTRHQCPACGAKNSFTHYLDGNTNEIINNKVGRCDRVSKCGYHYPPKQFFIDNPTYSRDEARLVSNYKSNPKPVTPPLPMGTINFSYVQNSKSVKSNLLRFLCEFMTIEQIQPSCELYALGATKSSEVIFWQIDINGNVRTGKIMQYNPKTGHRIKHESNAIDWVHNKLKKSGILPENFNLQQCFFGEHLLTLNPDKNVAIVESEKSAFIASVFMPDYVWLAAGNLNGLPIEKCKVLANRTVILFPDLGAFDKWTLKATEIQKKINCKIAVSTHLEKVATKEDRDKGLDIADFIIKQKTPKQTNHPIKGQWSPVIETLGLKPTHYLLIDKLQYEASIKT